MSPSAAADRSARRHLTAIDEARLGRLVADVHRQIVDDQIHGANLRVAFDVR